jgi:hypothetical protein
MIAFELEHSESDQPPSPDQLAAIFSVRDIDKFAFFQMLLPAVIDSMRRETFTGDDHAALMEQASQAAQTATESGETAPPEILRVMLALVMVIALSALACAQSVSGPDAVPPSDPTRPPPQASPRAPRAPGRQVQRTA